jgi:threonine dehydrogenase-like Zn-dependent dehydrogenase
MRAIAFDGSAVNLETDRKEPRPGPGEVLVRVLRAGICETDLQILAGYHSFRGVLGHEFVGIALGGALEGRRVVGEINCSCWTCDTCTEAAHPGHCPHRTVVGIVGRDGAFADLVALPERNLHAVPDAIDDEAAVFTEPVAAAFQIPTQLEIRRDHRVIVLGDGRLGNLCAQVLARFSDHVAVVGKYRHKLAALEALGIATRLLADAGENRAADIVVDCTGSATGLPAALQLVRPRGTVVLKTTIADEHRLSLAPVVVDEVTIVGSRCGPFDRALDALARGLVNVRPLISERFRLSDGVRALERAREPGVLKVLIDVAGGQSST